MECCFEHKIKYMFVVTQNKITLTLPPSLFVQRLLLLAIFLCWSMTGFTQEDDRSIPELWQAYEKAPNDSIQVSTLSALATAFVNVNLDSALILGETALEQAQKANLKSLEAGVYVSIGEVYDLAGQIEPALEHIDEGLKIFLALKDRKGIARAYNSRGLARLYANYQLDRAKADFKEARFVAQGDQDFARIAKIDHNLAQIYHREENYPLALEFYLKSRNLKDSLLAIDYPGITVRDQISTYNNLGVFYSTVYQFDQAREATKKALELTPEEEYRRRVVIYYSLGSIEERDSNYTEALTYYQQSLEASQKGGFTFYQPNIYDGMGKVYLMTNSEEAAGDHFMLALQMLNNDVPKPDVKVGVLAHQGELFVRQQKYYQALENTNEALAIAASNDNIPNENIRDAHDVKAKAAQALGDYPTAAYHLRKLVDINKLIESEEHKKQYVGLQAIRDVELNSNRYELKLANQELELSEKWVFWLQVAFSIAGLLAVAFAIAKFRETRAKKEVIVVNKELEVRNIEQANTNQKLNLANNKLRQFAFATGHDLKESLRNITSFTQLASIELAENPPQAQTHLQEAAAGGKRMRKMLDDLLHYSNLGGSDSTVSRFSLDEAISSVKQQLKEEIENSRGDVQLVTPATLKANRTEIEQIFFNLAHNALRYRSEEVAPRIKIKAEERDEKLVFMVCDNGLGIPKEHQQDIFKPFVRLHHRSQSGSGLGLAICQSIVDAYDGEFWHEDNEGNGSCFCFTLPKSEPKAQLNANLYIP